MESDLIARPTVSSYHIVVLKWQNRLKVGTDKPKLKVKMQSVSNDDVWKKNFLKSHVLSWWQKVYSDWKDDTPCDRAFQVFSPATVYFLSAA